MQPVRAMQIRQFSAGALNQKRLRVAPSHLSNACNSAAAGFA